MGNRTHSNIEKLHASRNYKLVPAAHQMEGEPVRSNSKAALENWTRKRRAQGVMTHTSVTFDRDPTTGLTLRSGGLGTLNTGRNFAKRLYRTSKRVEGKRCKGRGASAA